MQACLRKVHNTASDDHVLWLSAVQKLAEFRRLQYPWHMLYLACTTLGVATRNTTWFRVRDTVKRKFPEG